MPHKCHEEIYYLRPWANGCFFKEEEMRARVFEVGEYKTQHMVCDLCMLASPLINFTWMIDAAKYKQDLFVCKDCKAKRIYLCCNEHKDIVYKDWWNVSADEETFRHAMCAGFAKRITLDDESAKYSDKDQQTIKNWNIYHIAYKSKKKPFIIHQ